MATRTAVIPDNSGLISHATPGAEPAKIATQQVKREKTDSILLETQQAEDGTLHHISRPMQLKLSQKVVDHTYRLFGCQLTFAKDVPTYAITTPESLYVIS